ncbi:hypothetical protein GXP70_07955 [Paenibacillus lycopersici]|uniref:Uncharacterized protein n=1 Tax=Paenibacillus lycopersici TaxID=2704462 RepID=A0A6C0G063_9BACL|nr:hypothetical protein [Paenibacillus lycopersici]QHT59890.1 hypothetical protein GXP70_07955 [Paenibacillus lycopersici]
MPVSDKELVSILGTYERSSYDRASKSNYELNIMLGEYKATFNIWSVPLKATNKKEFNGLDVGEMITIILTADNSK